MLFFVLILVGVFTGILSGMLGIGGGLIFTPVFFYLFLDAGLPHPELWAIGSSLFCTFVASLGGTMRHLKEQSFYLREGVYCGLFGIAGTSIGKWVSTSAWFSKTEFTILILLLLVYTIIQLVIKNLVKRQPSREADARLFKDNRLMWPQTVVVGLAGGFIATLAGVGGGLLMVPILHLLYRQSYKKTVSVSETAIVLISIGGFLQLALVPDTPDGLTPFALGYVDFGASLPLVIGAFVGAWSGVWLHDRVPKRAMQLLHASLISIVIVLMIYTLIP